MRLLHGIILALGAVLFVVLVVNSPERLWEEGRKIGFAMVPIILLSGVEHWLHAMAWGRCFHERRPSRRRLVAAHLAGNAISFLTPTATLGGEVVRTTLLPPGILPENAIASVSIDRVAWAIADMALALMGVAAILLVAPLDAAARIWLLAGLAILVGATVYFLHLQRQGRLASFLLGNTVVRKICGPRFVETLARAGLAFDRRLAAYHAERKGDFRRCVATHVVATCMGGAQLWCFLYAMDLPCGPKTTLVVFLAGTAADVVFFFVPARLGVQEGSRALAAKLGGLGTGPGLLFSLVLRVEQLIWVGAGLVLYASLLPLSARREAGLQPPVEA